MVFRMPTRQPNGRERHPGLKLNKKRRHAACMGIRRNKQEQACAFIIDDDDSDHDNDS